MAFGQQSGPPASARQVEKLKELLRDAGHGDFRDARGPLGFTQRQAAGRFTRDEADDLIGRLRAAADGEAPAPVVAQAGRRDAIEQVLRRMPAEQLAAELQRRGWAVIAP
jgi:hypothetical protein